MNGKNSIGKRLSEIALCVRRGVTLYDVGTDHAYLPVFLVSEGIISSAVASDIAAGPLSKAEQNIAQSRLSERIKTVLTGGLDGIELSLPCDVVIAGMGGELISEIISNKKELKNSEIRLILQPMTKQELLRSYLAENGFMIASERLCREGKLYQIIVCSYSGEPYRLSESELYLGKRGARNENKLFFELAKQKLASLRTAAEGKRLGGLDLTCEENLIKELEAIIASESEK